MPFRLIIATGGGFTDHNLFTSKLDNLLSAKHPEVEIVIGFSLPGDAIGRQYAEDHGYPVKEFTGAYLRMGDMIRYADAAVVAWDGKSAGTKRLIDEVRAAGKPCKVVTFVAENKPTKKQLIIAGETLVVPDDKPKIKKPKKSDVVVDPAWRNKYQTAHEQWFAKEYPAGYQDGHYIDPNYPDPRTTNGITTVVINVLKWYGHYSNRQNVMGRQVGGITKTASGMKIDDRKWIKSSTRKGSSDIMAAIAGKMICLEIKNLVTKDTVKDAQQKERKRVEQSGSLYVIIRSVTEFFQWYENYMRDHPTQSTIFDSPAQV